MITNPVTHQVNKQTVVAHKNGSSGESKICNIKTKVFHCIGNIPRYSYKGTKDAVNYTYATITAHPGITASTVTVVEVACIALIAYSYKLLTNQETNHPIIAISTVIGTHVSVFIAALVAVALAIFDYKSLTNREADLSSIAISTVMVSTLSSLIGILVSLIAYVTLTSDHYTLC